MHLLPTFVPPQVCHGLPTQAHVPRLHLACMQGKVFMINTVTEKTCLLVENGCVRLISKFGKTFARTGFKCKC